MTDITRWYHNLQQRWEGCRESGFALVAAIAVNASPPPGAQLLPEEQERQKRYRFARDRAAYGLGRMLTRWLLMPDSPPRPFDRMPGGKPFLPGRPNFNISHGAGVLAVVFHDEPDIGIDIESLSRLGQAKTRYGLVCHPQEKSHLESLPPRESKAAFARCWTRKEALLKAAGLGVADNLAALDMQLGATAPLFTHPAIVQVRDIALPFDDCHCSLALPPHVPGYSIAVFNPGQTEDNLI